MAFASIHIPEFMVQAVVSARLHLHNRAIALVDGVPPLVKVVAVNAAALEAGIQPGMSKAQAAQFTGIEILNRSRAREKAAHAALLDLGWSISPRIEDHAPEEIIVDLAGLETLFGSHEKIAGELQRRASVLGLIAQVAVSFNQEVAIHAARGFPGITVIPKNDEAKFLGVLPVYALAPSYEALETFDHWGIHTCAALAALPVLQLSERLGQEGVRLHQRARGVGMRSLLLAEPQIYFEEEMELDEAVEDLEPLAFILGRLLDQLCARLQARSLAASAIRLRFDLGDLFLQDAQGESRKPHPSEIAEKVYRKTLTLPVAMRDSKMLLKLMRLQLQSDPPSGSIVKVTLAADPARPRSAQSGLFVPISPDPEKLELTVARLSKLVGASNIGSPQLVDTHRPGEFRMSRFVPPSNERGRELGIARKTKTVEFPRSAMDKDVHPCRPSTAFRIFRPRLQANVELRAGSPARVFFRGMRGYVMAASGPWRSSGDWWREDSWQQDEWDLDIRFDTSSTTAPRGPVANQPAVHQTMQQPVQAGLYCFCYDSVARSWFVRGVYD
jgi:protein ImuB